MNRRKLTDEEIAGIEEMRGRGLSFEQIGRKLGRSGSTIEYACRHYVIEEDQPKPGTVTGPNYSLPRVITCRDRTIRRFSEDEDTKLSAWSKQGIGNKEIGRRLCRHHTSIKARLETLARHEERRDRAGLQVAA